ncbi:uncharacterized protein K02A2.6-like [Temnothorax curvispinosus]|uniref:RNA-directed DNA polymerase n=1 Tax=Temnothorax curvispinosus TaxID=300111 RepID=A0A6J1PHD8_9HYME|nr:uncharacterized protein K02A2.6-like [Temnothorax curvispinosus]
MEVPTELMQALTSMLANAIRTSASNAAAATSDATNAAGVSTSQPRPPHFVMPEYRSSESTTVADYFKRFDWALQLSNIQTVQHANYARVHMGIELNNALKFLISPRLPEQLDYDDIKTTLISHFDRVKNKYAESVKFRHITQHKGELVANFALRLKQGAVYCDYGDFLDRMLIEQMLHGLQSREMCDEIIAKKPITFSEAYEIAHALEATRNTADEVKTSTQPATVESTNVLHAGQPQIKKPKDPFHRRASSRNREHQRTQSKGRKEERPNRNTRSSCSGCGGHHARKDCKFLDSECHNCGKKGHIAKVCKSKKQATDQIAIADQPAEQIAIVQRLNRLNQLNAHKPCERRMLTLEIDGCNLEMELDSGAPCSIISIKALRKIKPHFSLQSTDRQFASYTHHRLKCIGRLPVNVTLGNTTRKANLYVVNGDYDTLMGREWITQFAHEIDFVKLFAVERVHGLTIMPPHLTVEQSNRLNTILQRYNDVFSEAPGKLIGPPVSVHLKPGATPIFARAREIPLALRETYAREIDAKLAQGFYKRVEHSEWASTTHIVMKKNGKMRITGNYKPTLNPRMVIDEHPIPKIEHMFQKMKGAKVFCHLDITDAYTHLTVDETFSHALTLNTPTHGLIRPTRAVYGAANIPAKWQRRMEVALEGIENALNFFDDVIVFADDFDKLFSILDTILERFRAQGLKLNRAKCTFAAPSVEFLGHRINGEGLHKSDKHIATIRDAPKPSTPEQLQLFLGKATYYRSFIPDLATKERPLRDMLLTETFKWTPTAEAAYSEIKNLLTSPQVLIPYDPALPLLLATDASKTGLGAVLSHRLSNGEDRPIAYASRTLSATEQRYPQIDKEALAIVWAVRKFFYYLYARHFTLITDHKPLTQIFHPEKSLPILCISRMANYADYLAHFDYNIVFKPTKANANADYCSRVPLPTMGDPVNKITFDEEEEVEQYDDFDQFVLHQVRQLPVRADHIARETRKDPHLGKIVQSLQAGQNLAHVGYKAPEANYTLAADCLLFEHRVVVPPTLRQPILEDLHAAHLGIVKMKGMARSFVYWPGIDSDIERIAKSCIECAKHAHAPPQFHSHHWEYPRGPWERIHIDYAGPVTGVMLLIIVDAYSKWIEVKPTSSTTSAATIAILDELFATYGIPTTVVSDNGTQFTSAEFKAYLQASGVKYHKRTAPYHPATNGQAERYVQTTKDKLNKMATTRNTLQRDLNEFLRQYRRAPHSTTGQPPALLFLGRNLRTRLDLVRPEDTRTRVMKKQQAENETPFRIFKPAQKVYFLSGNPRMDKWVPGTIVTRLGDLHYEIDYKGRRFKRHVNQIRAFLETKPPDPFSVTDSSVPEAKGPKRSRRVRFYGTDPKPDAAPAAPPVAAAPPILAAPRDSPRREQTVIARTDPPRDRAPVGELRRSSRPRRPTQRYSP